MQRIGKKMLRNRTEMHADPLNNIEGRIFVEGHQEMRGYIRDPFIGEIIQQHYLMQKNYDNQRYGKYFFQYQKFLKKFLSNND